MKQPYFTIVVPTLDEEKFLPDLLNNLSDQTYDNFEVIHVDGNSDDNTVEEAKKFADKINLRQFSTEVRDASYQRNLGGKEAKGEWIIFVDADSQFDKDFLEILKKQITKYEQRYKGIDTFTCVTVLKEHEKKVLKYQTISKTINSNLVSTSKTNFPCVLGAMLGVRSSWFKVVKFDEDAKFSEDRFLVRDLIANGAKYRLLTKPVYYYSMRRFEDHSIAKISTETVAREIKLLLFNKRDADYKYPMNGGKYY